MVQKILKGKKYGLILLMLWLTIIENGVAQDFLLQGWYWDYPKTCNGGNWAQQLNNDASDLGQAGFTHVWLPPLSRASFGNCSVGYDPKDLYDLGEYGLGPTGFGTRQGVDALIQQLSNYNIQTVADVVYNHRDGGDPEINPAVKAYITQHMQEGKSPYPSDRYRCLLPLGGTSGNGAGDYYIKISSKTESNNYYNYAYRVYTFTNASPGYQGEMSEDENNNGQYNGGAGCGQGYNDLSLNYSLNANLDDNSNNCLTDEFKLTLTGQDFDANGDTLYIYLNNNGAYSDHRIYAIWNASANQDVIDQLQYQTYTDFTNMPSGQGAMNFENFKPNTNNTSTTYLNGDWDWPWFFNDYDQYSTDTQNKLFDWTKWLWNDVGIRGLRMDAVKHFNPEFIGDLMDHLYQNNIEPGLVIGEYYDANAFVVKSWLDNVHASMDEETKQHIQVRAFDFGLRDALKAACDNFGYDAREVFQKGLVNEVGVSPFQSVTFVNNHDFRDAGQPVQNDVILAYAYTLTNNQVGVPCVFYPEYFGVENPNAPLFHYQEEINELIQIHKSYIYGASAVTYLNAFNTFYTGTYSGGFANASLIYQLSGSESEKEVVVAINFAGEPLKVNHTLNMANLSDGDTLTDVLERSNYPFAIVENNGIYMEVPARSYAVWVQGNENFTVHANHLNVEPTYKVVPNPGYDVFTIQGQNVPTNIEVVNMHGDVVHNIKQRNQLNLQSLEPGVYFLHISHEGKQQYEKIVKL